MRSNGSTARDLGRELQQITLSTALVELARHRWILWI